MMNDDNKEPAKTDEVTRVSDLGPTLSEIKRDPDTGAYTHSVGRRTELTPHRFKALVTASRNMLNLRDSAAQAQIHHSTLALWFKKGEELEVTGELKYDERLVDWWLEGKRDENKQRIIPSNDVLYNALYRRCEQAKSDYVHNLTIALQVAALGDPANGKAPDGKLILDILSRRRKKDWGLPAKERNTLNVGVDGAAPGGSGPKVVVYIPKEVPLEENDAKEEKPV